MTENEKEQSEIKEPSQEKEPSRFDNLLSKAKDSVTSTSKVVAEKSSQLASSAVDIAGSVVKKTGETAKVTADYVGEGFDVASGKKILNLVEERLELQMQYNNVLAVKLEEALNRIEALEEKAKP